MRSTIDDVISAASSVDTLDIDDIAYVMIYTYAVTMQARKKQGVNFHEFSSQDYDAHRSLDFPCSKTIVRKTGSWENAKKVLPIPSRYSRTRNVKTTLATPQKFYNILQTISRCHNIEPIEVSIPMFEKYTNSVNDDDILSWRSYARHISPQGTWDEAKSIACSQCR